MREIGLPEWRAAEGVDSACGPAFMHADLAEAQFRGLLESAPDGVLVADADGRIAVVNARMEQLFGYARKEMIGQPVEMLIPEDVRSRHVGHRRRVRGGPAHPADGRRTGAPAGARTAARSRSRSASAPCASTTGC